MFRPPQRPLPTQSPPLAREWWLGPLLGAGEAANWIGTLQKHISCSSLGERGVCRGRGRAGWALQTVFVLGLSLTLSASSL